MVDSRQVRTSFIAVLCDIQMSGQTPKTRVSIRKPCRIEASLMLHLQQALVQPGGAEAIVLALQTGLVNCGHPVFEPGEAVEQVVATDLV